MVFFLLLFVPPNLARNYIVYIIFYQEKNRQGGGSFSPPFLSGKNFRWLYLLALLQDAAAFYACVIITLITPIIFRTKPWIAGRAAAGRTTKRAGWAATSIATIVTRCTTGAVIAVDGVIWVIAFPFRCPGSSSIKKKKKRAQKNE